MSIAGGAFPEANTRGEAARLAVIVCSVGRPECLAELVPALARQSRPADRILFVVSDPRDVALGAETVAPQGAVEVLLASKGSAPQRNAGLDAVAGDCDIVVFFDDDYVPSVHALAGIEAAFAQWPEVGGMTGHLIADGIKGPGIGHGEALRMVADWDDRTPPTGPLRAPRIRETGLPGLYGCNMACRMESVGTTRFDERLPLYAWQEDIDFAARLSGDLIETDAFAGVHRGVKSGREASGLRLGYSQIANPWYLWRKGTMTAGFAARLAMRNFLANHLKMFRPEPWIDRRGRARGNWVALRDLVSGAADPERILRL